MRHDPVTTIDLYRIFAEISDARISAETVTDGASLAPLLRAPKAAMPTRDLMWAGRICRPRGCVDSGTMPISALASQKLEPSTNTLPFIATSKPLKRRGSNEYVYSLTGRAPTRTQVKNP